MITRCKVDDCNGLGMPNGTGKRVYPKGYCAMHYMRLKRHGEAGVGGGDKKHQQEVTSTERP